MANKLTQSMVSVTIHLVERGRILGLNYLKISKLNASGTVFTDRARWHFMAFYGILGKRK
jgi:hypothetical protein